MHLQNEKTPAPHGTRSFEQTRRPRISIPNLAARHGFMIPLHQADIRRKSVLDLLSHRIFIDGGDRHERERRETGYAGQAFEQPLDDGGADGEPSALAEGLGHPAPGADPLAGHLGRGDPGIPMVYYYIALVIIR